MGLGVTLTVVQAGTVLTNIPVEQVYHSATTHNIATNNKSNKNLNNSNDSTTTYNNNISVEKRKLI